MSTSWCPVRLLKVSTHRDLCISPGDVYPMGPELSLDLSTLQWYVLVLDSIREIGSSIPRNIYFEILLSVR